MRRFLNRHRNILDFAISSLLRRQGKNLSLLLLYILVVFVIGSVTMMVTALKREAGLILQDAPDLVVQKMTLGRHDLMPAGYGRDIAAIRGVNSVQRRLWGYYFDAATKANYTFMASDDLQGDNEGVIVGSGVARVRKAAKGDLITFQGFDRQPQLFTVRDILPLPSELAAADLVLLSEQRFRAFFALAEGSATDLAVTVRNRQEIGTIAAKIVDRYPDARPISKQEILRTYDSIFDWRGGMMVAIVGAAICCFIIFAWDRATGLSAEERKEIGILKSIGWETSDVLILKMWEGIVISLTAFLTGTIAAYCHVFFFSAKLLEHPLKGWAVLYPRFQLLPVVDFYQIGVLFFLSVIPYTIATVIPSWRAATIDPDAAMRS